MKKLRLDYFLSLGLKLVKLDKYTLWDRDYVISGKDNAFAMSLEDKYNKHRFITSFAPRKNTGEQPCVGGLPIVIENGIGQVVKGRAIEFHFPLPPACVTEIKTWKPCIESLIKMQDEHDKGISKRKEQEDKQKKPVEWVNGSECTVKECGYGLRDGAKDFIGADCIVMSSFKTPLDVDCIAVYTKGSGCEVFVSEMIVSRETSEDKAAQQKAARERDEKAKALAEICWIAFDCEARWENAGEDTRECYAKMIDAGVQLPG